VDDVPYALAMKPRPANPFGCTIAQEESHWFLFRLSLGMNFEKHLFISYAHVDNMTTPDDPRGWVARFHEYLESYLSTNIGATARIWRDERLRGDDVFAKEIFKQFPQTAVLVSVISPRYLESKWCLDEVVEFSKVAARTGGLIIDDKSRILKVMLKPVPPERLEAFPSVMRDMIGYEFYHEAEGRRVLPLDPAFGSGEAYRRNIYFLAEDIADLVRKLSEQADTPLATPAPAAKPAVYLAESSYDRAEDRERLRGELRAHGYMIVPDQRMPELEREYMAEVTRLLSQCQLSIHMIGSVRGKSPDGPSQKSAIQIQQELAVQQSKERRLERLIWLPADTRSDQPDHQAFLDALRGNAEMQRMADLIAGDLEELKSAARAALKRIEDPKPQTTIAPDSGPPTVYLICVEDDVEAAVPLMECLGEKGYNVELPVFTGDSASVREANEAVAMACRGALLFFGAGDGAWRKHQLSELTRVQGSRRDNPLRANFTYLAAPDTTDKKVPRFKKESNLIDGIAGFQPSLLAPFLKALV